MTEQKLSKNKEQPKSERRSSVAKGKKIVTVCSSSRCMHVPSGLLGFVKRIAFTFVPAAAADARDSSSAEAVT